MEQRAENNTVWLCCDFGVDAHHVICCNRKACKVSCTPQQSYQGFFFFFGLININGFLPLPVISTYAWYPDLWLLHHFTLWAQYYFLTLTAVNHYWKPHHKHFTPTWACKQTTTLREMVQGNYANIKMIIWTRLVAPLADLSVWANGYTHTLHPAPTHPPHFFIPAVKCHQRWLTANLRHTWIWMGLWIWICRWGGQTFCLLSSFWDGSVRKWRLSSFSLTTERYDWPTFWPDGRGKHCFVCFHREHSFKVEVVIDNITE